jgi:dolichol-phosphate mannosyltransferase
VSPWVTKCANSKSKKPLLARSVQLSIVIPTYNEAENLPRLVSALFSLPLEEVKVLIVDDNSPDGTGKLAEELASQAAGRISVLHRPGKMGLGSAYISGFRCALDQGANAVAQMDADFSHPPELLVKLLASLHTCDIAMGSRYVRGGAVDTRWPVWRKGLSAFGNFYARSILGLKIRDATGGYRLWRRQALEKMPLNRVRSNGYAFQVEMAYIAQKSGFTALEVPFYFADRRWGQSKMSFSIQKEAAIRVLQMRLEYRDI